MIPLKTKSINFFLVFFLFCRPLRLLIFFCTEMLEWFFLGPSEWLATVSRRVEASTWRDKCLCLFFAGTFLLQPTQKPIILQVAPLRSPRWNLRWVQVSRDQSSSWPVLVPPLGSGEMCGGHSPSPAGIVCPHPRPRPWAGKANCEFVFS